jgi:hypothetical protein
MDAKVNAQLGVAAVAIHAHDDATSTARDLLYRIDVATDQPFLRRFYRVGLGDLRTGSGLGSSDPRFDFETVAILADGRFAVSFMDSRHKTPAMAIEQTTTLP